MKKYLIALATVAGVGIAQGAIITSTAPSFTVANDDLLQTSVSSVTDDGSDFRQSGGQLTFLNELENEGITVGTASLTDGVWYNHNPSAWVGINDALDNGNTESRGSAVTTPDTSGTWNLNLVASPLGYNVNQIDLYSNWGNGDGRNEIRVNINYSLVATPTVFDQVLTVDATTLFVYNPVAVVGSVDGTQGKMSLTDLGLTGVAGVRFAFPSTQENGGVGYSELDVIGSAIPEPGTLGLVAAFGGGVLFIRRRFMI